MELDESHRHALHDALQAVLGAGPTATLMGHLPPVGWADVATKHDLQELERRLDLRFERVDLRFVDVDRRLANLETGLDHVRSRVTDLAVSLHTEMNRQTMALMFGLGSLIVTMSGVIAAALYFSSG